MTQQLEVVVSELSKASARLKDAGQRLQDGLSSVDLETGQLLGSGWKGDAATAFGSAWDRWHSGAGQVVRGLQSMSDLLSVAAKEYAKTDEQGAGAIGSSMQGGGTGGGGTGGGGGANNPGPASAPAQPTGAGGAGGSGGGAAGVEQLTQQLPSLAQQMMGSMGQIGQLAQPLTQAAAQAAQLATGLVQQATGQSGADPSSAAGTAPTDDAAKDDTDKAEKDRAAKDPAEERHDQTGGTAATGAGPAESHAEPKAPAAQAPAAHPAKSRPQIRPID